MKQPKLLPSNKYNQQHMTRVVIQFTRRIPFTVALEYVWACYEVFYPWFYYREQAEDAFEEVIQTAINEGVTLAQALTVTLGIIDQFKEQRNFR